MTPQQLDERIADLLSVDRRAPDKQLPIVLQIKQLLRDVVEAVVPDDMSADVLSPYESIGFNDAIVETKANAARLLGE